MPMQNPVVGGGGGLIRNWIQSPDFETGVVGWRIARDGSAEFNNLVLRGSWTVQSGTAQMRGDIEDIPATPYSAASQRPTISFNPDTAAYAPGFIFATPKNVNGESSLVFSTPDFIADALSPSTMALVADYTKQYSYFDVTGLGFARYHHDRFAELVEEDTSSAAVGPGNGVTMVSANGSTEESPYAQLMVLAGWHGITLAGPSATIGNNRVTMTLRMDGVQVRGARLILQNTTQTQSGGMLMYVGPTTPVQDLITFDLRMEHESTSSATSASVNASATSPAWIAVKGF